jgi:hypothetical protein
VEKAQCGVHTFSVAAATPPPDAAVAPRIRWNSGESTSLVSIPGVEERVVKVCAAAFARRSASRGNRYMSRRFGGIFSNVIKSRTIKEYYNVPGERR